jgi:hypothetical protein
MLWRNSVTEGVFMLVESTSWTARPKRKIEIVFRRDQSAGVSIGMQYKTNIYVRRSEFKDFVFQRYQSASTSIRQVSPFHRSQRPLRRVEAQLYSIFDLGTRRGWEVSITSRPHLTPGKDTVPIVQEAGWASGPVWTSAEILVPTGIRSPDRPVHRQSLYRLRYPAHRHFD